VLIVHTNDLYEDELGSELLYLLRYEWTLPLEVNTAGIGSAKLSTIDA
jgi:hypothetical protein